MKIQVGIDPDINRSGVCIRHDGVITRLEAWTIGELVTELIALKTFNPEARVLVAIEGGWLVKKSNFRVKAKTARYGEAVANDTGKNAGYGMAIADLLTHYKFNPKVIRPINKKPFKINGSWTPEGRIAFDNANGFPRRYVNDDIRDAVMISLFA